MQSHEDSKTHSDRLNSRLKCPILRNLKFLKEPLLFMLRKPLNSYGIGSQVFKTQHT